MRAEADGRRQGGVNLEEFGLRFRFMKFATVANLFFRKLRAPLRRETRARAKFGSDGEQRDDGMTVSAQAEAPVVVQSYANATGRR